jgi:hypothetical protein
VATLAAAVLRRALAARALVTPAAQAPEVTPEATTVAVVTTAVAPEKSNVNEGVLQLGAPNIINTHQNILVRKIMRKFY